VLFGVKDCVPLKPVKVTEVLSGFVKTTEQETAFVEPQVIENGSSGYVVVVDCVSEAHTDIVDAQGSVVVVVVVVVQG
jgi:hypothetical protein